VDIVGPTLGVGRLSVTRLHEASVFIHWFRHQSVSGEARVIISYYKELLGVGGGGLEDRGGGAE